MNRKLSGFAMGFDLEPVFRQGPGAIPLASQSSFFSSSRLTPQGRLILRRPLSTIDHGYVRHHPARLKDEAGISDPVRRRPANITRRVWRTGLASFVPVSLQSRNALLRP